MYLSNPGGVYQGTIAKESECTPKVQLETPDPLKKAVIANLQLLILLLILLQIH